MRSQYQFNLNSNLDADNEQALLAEQERLQAFKTSKLSKIDQDRAENSLRLISLRLSTLRSRLSAMRKTQVITVYVETPDE